MQSYKLSVSKGGKKYTIVFKAENEKMARERVHSEWYSILSIEEIVNKEVLWNVFLFSWYNNVWELKNWKIVWDDIFKIYVKLRKNLEYNVVSLFSEADKDLSQDDKNKIVKNLDEEYNLYFSSKKEKLEEKANEIVNKKINSDNKIDSFYLKKELDETYKLISHVLIKIQNLLSGEAKIELDYDQKEKLKTIYNSIVKFKKTTNISKLKEIWELALLKIWNIELSDVENQHKATSEVLLKETNNLLKKIWSKESFVKKENDLVYILSSFLEKVKFYYDKLKTVKKDKEVVDINSHSYIKNMLFLKKYKEKLKENNVFIFKNLLSIVFNSEKRLDVFIRRKVIKQNITLFKAKEKWVWFSYTTVKKWLSKLIEMILRIIRVFRLNLFIVIFFYTLLFIIYLNINVYYAIWNPNYDGIFYFLVLYFLYLILYFTRNLLLIILNFVILFFIIIFWVVNF